MHAGDRASIIHQVAPGQPVPDVGANVNLVLDWPLRHARMRVHTALHLLSVVVPFPVTGGAIGDGDGRLDFDWPDPKLDREAIAEHVQAMVDRDAAVTERWITDAELLANPGLVKTMSVKPPMGTGRVRLVEIVGLDLQPCGGTHVRRTGEIGRVLISGIEKKGKQNRRVRLSLDSKTA
jgi:misacylated tRNA(Ala) deacylase